MATAARAPLRPDTAVTVAPVGDKTANLRRRIAYLAMTAWALVMFVPFLYSLATAFKPRPQWEVFTFIPSPVTLENWQTAFTELDPTLPRLFFNSALLAAMVTLSNLALGSLAGYAFARLRFPGREALFLLVLATMMIPDQLRLVPIYTTFVNLGLVTSQPTNYLAPWLVLAISAASVFLLRQFFLSIPKDLEEAARLDGAGFFTTFYRVMLPLATPALAAVAILSFQGAWNGFFWPLILLQERAHWTLPLGLGQFRFLYSTQWGPLMAVVVLATIPIVILFVVFQRYFVEGVAASGVKG